MAGATGWTREPFAHGIRFLETKGENQPLMEPSAVMRHPAHDGKVTAPLVLLPGAAGSSWSRLECSG
jgi:hypothetical protein